MDCDDSEPPLGPRREDLLPASAERSVEVVVVGGFGVGRTTMVGSAGGIRPLATEETTTRAGVGADDLSGVERKTETAVAMDSGRITLDDRLVLHLFGTPGQQAARAADPAAPPGAARTGPEGRGPAGPWRRLRGRVQPG